MLTRTCYELVQILKGPQVNRAEYRCEGSCRGGEGM